MMNDFARHTRNLGLDLVRVTEAAALAAGGRGNLLHPLDICIVAERDRMDDDIFCGGVAGRNDRLGPMIVDAVGHENHRLGSKAPDLCAGEHFDPIVQASRDCGAAFDRLRAHAVHLVANLRIIRNEIRIDR